MSKLVDASTVSPDTVYKSLVIENEKLKKALEIAKLKLKTYSSRDRWNHARSESPTFYLQGSEDKGYEMADKALKEIREVLK